MGRGASTSGKVGLSCKAAEHPHALCQINAMKLMDGLLHELGSHRLVNVNARFALYSCLLPPRAHFFACNRFLGIHAKIGSNKGLLGVPTKDY